MSKEALWKLLELQSSSPKNDVYIGKMRALSGDIFKKYGVKEFDYKNELNVLANWMSHPSNYKVVSDLVGKTVKLSGDYDFDDQVILGSLALSLGNIIRVDNIEGSPAVMQYVPKDFAGRSGISNFNSSLGDGEWLVIKVDSRYEKPKVQKLARPVNLSRDSHSNQEVLASGDAGIRTTVKKMANMTREYLANDTFHDDRDKIVKWAKSVLGSVGTEDKSEYLNTLANTISDPRVVRYEKDPLCIQNGRLQSHEWLVVPGRTLEAGVADCDDFSLLMGCLAGLMGLGVTYRVAGCDPKKQASFSHVYPIITYPNQGLDGIANTNDVFVDIVYQKRIGDSGYGKEPRRFRYFDVKVL